MFSRRERERPDRISIYNDLRQTRRSGIRTAVLATILISGIVPAITMIWNSDSSMPTAVYFQQLGSVLLHTYPLTVAIALIVLSKEQGWVRWGSWIFAATVIAGCATVGNFIGDATGQGVVQPASLISTDHPLFVVPATGANYLGGFYLTYGLRTFLAAFLVGIFAGKTASRFIKHVPRNRREVVELAAELVEHQAA
jgi:hypothetical protein